MSILAFALVWSLLLYYIIYRASLILTNPQQSGLVQVLLEFVGLQRMTAWPVPEMAVYWYLGLLIMPFFCLTLTADQTASDRARGTLRFILLRATRWQLFFGRFLGQMWVQALLILATTASVLVITAMRSSADLAGWTQEGIAVVVNLFIVLLPYTALMAVVSVMARSARQATTYAVILWIVFWFLARYLLAKFPDMTALEWILPGAQLKAQMRSVGWDAFALAPIPLLQMAVLLLVGWLLVRRIDL